MNHRLLLALLLVLTTIWGCTSTAPKPPAPSIIPEPVSMEVGNEQFHLDRGTHIIADTSNAEIRNIATQLKEKIDSATGYDLPISTNKSSGTPIILKIDRNTGGYINNEAYRLTSSQDSVHIRAPSAAGLFYGMQSLLQLFPAQIYQTDYTLVPQHVRWSIPAVKIRDYPRFGYRGMHLDVARHFFSVEFVKRYIDLMAMHKMNRFHWHLTEDQGWRIEIEQYPRLTEVGAWRDSTLVGHYGTGIYDGERYGGYYTQEEIREVVAYAQQRHVTIIPEIEMPGHASAALAAYPELGCIEGKDYQVKTTWGIFEDIYCPSEQTFTFLKNVLTEVMDLFPSKYIHIGGDEAPKKQWKESELAQQVMQRENLNNEEQLQSLFYYAN
ncbi:MAG: beta-N-acetylhexosaminidase [Fodinibius sp.]|nr:beta-N-acetylhexosaminidase [Fodinibius sp.]